MISKKVLHHLADQLAHVLYSIKQNNHFPMRYPLVLMSLISLFIRLFVTKSIWVSTFVSIFFASLVHFVIVLYIYVNITIYISCRETLMFYCGPLIVLNVRLFRERKQTVYIFLSLIKIMG